MKVFQVTLRISNICANINGGRKNVKKLKPKQIFKIFYKYFLVLITALLQMSYKSVTGKLPTGLKNPEKNLTGYDYGLEGKIKNSFGYITGYEF